MKKIMSLLLSCVMLFSGFIKYYFYNISTNVGQPISVNQEKNNLEINNTGNLLSLCNDEVNPEYLANDIFNYYGIDVNGFNIDEEAFLIQGTKMVSLNDILDTEQETEEKNQVLEISLFYKKDEECAYLTAFNEQNAYQETIQLYPEFYDSRFEGNTLVINEGGENQQINIFDMDDSNEENELVRAMLLSFCGLALWKIIKAAVVIIIAVTMVAYPEFYVSGIKSLCDVFETFTTKIIQKVKYKFIKMVDGVVDEIAQIRQKNSKNIYYIVMPITNENQKFYPNATQGDMLISDYPVTYSEAKKFLWAGYSIYTFEEYDAYRVIKMAWIDGIAIDEPCDEGFSVGFYSHYHAYYKDGNILKKRYVQMDNFLMAVHGFYGYPW